MDSFTQTRILDLIAFPWADLPFSRYLLENIQRFKVIQVEVLRPGGCSTEELQQEGWITAKNSADAILRLVESIYSVTDDKTMAKYVSENWDQFFTKKSSVTKRKHFEKFFSEIPNCDKLRTLSVLKACSKDCVNIATHMLDEQFSQICTFKHPAKHQIVIKTVSNVKEQLRVVHHVESVARMLSLCWQLVIDFQWVHGSFQTQISLLIVDVIWKRKEAGSELEEAVSCKIVLYSKPVLSIVSSTEESDSEISTDRDSMSRLSIGASASSIDEEEITFKEIDDVNVAHGSIVVHSVTQLLSRSIPTFSSRHVVLQCANPSLLVANTPRTPGEFASVSMESEDYDSKYSAPFLLPGEVIQTSMPNIKHKYDVPTDSQSDGVSGEKKKWFGSRFATATKKVAKTEAIDGCLLFTTFQVIFVPAFAVSMSSESTKGKAIFVPSEVVSISRNTKGNILRGGHRRELSKSSTLGSTISDLQEKTKKTFEEVDTAPSVKDVDEHIYLPYQAIYKVDRVGKKHLSVHCKDFRTLHFSFKMSERSIGEFMRAIKIYLPGNPTDSFAPRFAAEYRRRLSEVTVDGWDIYNAETELVRMLKGDSAWRISEANLNFELCDTYPRLLAVPTSISDETLMAVKEFRSRGRLPALSWRHPHSGASLTRCSQPRVGLSRTRSKEDETLLWEIMLTNQLPTAEGKAIKPLYLLDARPRANAMANQAVGAGYEMADHYKQTKLKFLQIPNIHVMRDSLRKLHDLSLPYADSSTYLTQLESSHWLEYIQLILRSALRIAKLLSSGSNVLIHCSDGWDRTSQLSSVAMLLLDPFYRTLKGFIYLIEKEWLGYGHKFEDRCGHNIGKTGEAETSPILLQFVDCVWQIMQQFPSEFEFNQLLLIAILDHSGISQFGTFLGNCVREREEHNTAKNTASLWTFIYQSVDVYTSPHYVGYQDPEFMELVENECVYAFLRPHTALKSIRLWTDYYLRYDRTVPKGELFGEQRIWGWHMSKEKKEEEKKDEEKDLLIQKLQNELKEERAKVDKLETALLEAQ